MMKHQIQWMAPSPFWKTAALSSDPATRASINRPEILRFATDLFMDEFLVMLEGDPARMADLQAEPETWRGPAAVAEPVEQLPPFARSLNRSRLARMRSAKDIGAPSIAGNGSRTFTSRLTPLKLYQPSHQRYYLIAATLVCRMTGFPDHKVDPGRHEKASFVVRRLRSSTGGTSACSTATCDEYAFVSTPSGNRWQKVTGLAATALASGEEKLPLSAMGFLEDDGRKRQLFAGLIPVSNREAYAAAGESNQGSDGGTATAEPDVRSVLFQQQVSAPWAMLIERAVVTQKVFDKVKNPPPPASSDDASKNAYKDSLDAATKASRERTQATSWYILLDFAKYLQQYLPNVWGVVAGGAPDSGLNSPERALMTALSSMSYADPAGGILSLADALGRILAFESPLETVTSRYSLDAPDPLWPSMRFALVDPDPDPAAQVVRGAPTMGGLNNLVNGALPADKPAGLPPLPLAAQVPLDRSDPGWFVIRCVYERPDCGPLDPPVISEPTEIFQMAGFFDSDAPARPIRIGLPLDTSLAGLRKFDKNTAFMISDMLCGQMTAMCNLSLGDLVLSVLPWPFHKDLDASGMNPKPCTDPSGGASAGMMCSFSIPIITICALILLIIMVKLFDMVFSWMAFFKFCFSLPKFKAKSGG
jgi:hypothetical protein